MTASVENYRQALNEIVQDVKAKWSIGAARGDSYKLGYNAACFNILGVIEDLSFNHGIARGEIGLDTEPDLTVWSDEDVATHKGKEPDDR
ncbi:hypothetical protein [Brevundimonas sp. GCM10030266]|uniref:hypothetical protein n=1 Tax=Brevundimonas sp. GCM10030266 TaxID=3273386 RepID=UPI00360ED4EA